MTRSSLSIVVVAGALCLAGCGGGSESAGNNGSAVTASETTAAPVGGATTPERSLVTASPAEPEATGSIPETFGVDAIVRFDPGGTSATISDALIRGERNRYTLDAAAGQTMILSLASLENNAVFDVFGPDNSSLAAEGTEASIVLPSDGTYTIVVGGTRGNASYDLTVEIPAG